MGLMLLRLIAKEIMVGVLLLLIRPRPTDLRVYSRRIRLDRWKARAGKELHKAVTTSGYYSEHGGVVAERAVVRGGVLLCVGGEGG